MRGSKVPGALLFSEKSNNVEPLNEVVIGILVIDSTVDSSVQLAGVPPVFLKVCVSHLVALRDAINLHDYS